MKADALDVLSFRQRTKSDVGRVVVAATDRCQSAPHDAECRSRNRRQPASNPLLPERPAAIDAAGGKAGEI